MGEPRNMDGIQFEVLRKLIDQHFYDLHDELEVCYYQYWKIGLSSPWLGVFDVQATPEESKALFDLLHGAIFWLRDLIFHFKNQELALYSQDQYRYIRDELGAIQLDLTQSAKDKLQLRLTVGQLQTLRTELESRFGEVFPWAAPL